MHALCAVIPPDERETSGGRTRSQTELSDADIEHHLSEWARWHRKSRFHAFRQLLFPPAASGGMGNSGSTTFDDLCAALDGERAKILNTLIDDLPTTQRCAIHYVFLEAHAVFRLPRASLADEYSKALSSLRPGMERKGLV